MTDQDKRNKLKAEVLQAREITEKLIAAIDNGTPAYDVEGLVYDLAQKAIKMHFDKALQ